MLIALGVFVGAISGFFGVGGGFVLVPLLLMIGIDIKTAIGISVVQMVFSSIFGSYLNYKKKTLQIDSSMLVGVGGAFGALFSGYVVSILSPITLKALFIVLVGIAILQMLRPTHSKAQKDVHPSYLFIVGFFAGAIAISLGVGGSVLIVPILVGFLYYPIKKAVSAGLFFVVFSSLAGFISMSYYGHIDYASGLIVGISALVGVSFGIWLKDKVNDKQHKRYILILYTIIFLYMTYEFITRTVL
ncbi:MAG: sulfite exporter TauE/SafE family protein [Campylobacterota bacterium]